MVLNMVSVEQDWQVNNDGVLSKICTLSDILRVLSTLQSVPLER
jgi:hypothetical protein